MAMKKLRLRGPGCSPSLSRGPPWAQTCVSTLQRKTERVLGCWVPLRTALGGGSYAHTLDSVGTVWKQQGGPQSAPQAMLRL